MTSRCLMWPGGRRRQALGDSIRNHKVGAKRNKTKNLEAHKLPHKIRTDINVAGEFASNWIFRHGHAVEIVFINVRRWVQVEELQNRGGFHGGRQPLDTACVWGSARRSPTAALSTAHKRQRCFFLVAPLCRLCRHRGCRLQLPPLTCLQLRS